MQYTVSHEKLKQYQVCSALVETKRNSRYKFNSEIFCFRIMVGKKFNCVFCRNRHVILFLGHKLKKYIIFFKYLL